MYSVKLIYLIVIKLLLGNFLMLFKNKNPKEKREGEKEKRRREEKREESEGKEEKERKKEKNTGLVSKRQKVCNQMSLGLAIIPRL